MGKSSKRNQNRFGAGRILPYVKLLNGDRTLNGGPRDLAMNLTIEELEDGIRCVGLQGRLDLAGSAAIDLKFSSHAASARGLVLVDLSGVEFLASIGIRTFLTAAKAQQRRGGRMVLCNAVPSVAKVIETAGLGSVIPLAADRAAGIAWLLAP